MDIALIKHQNKPKTSYQPVNAEFSCDCSVCHSQARNKILSELSRKECLKIDYSTLGERKRFTWLLSELGKQSVTQEVTIPTPDIVVFNKSRPVYLLQCSKDVIKYITSGDKLGLTEILKSYTKVVRGRKKEDKPGSKPQESYGKEIGLLRYTVKNKENDNLDETPELEDGPLRVLSEKEFFEFMYERAGSLIWKNVVYIQTVVKCKTGIANIITISYKTPAKMDLEDLKKSFNTSVDEDLMVSNPTAYCELLCKRVDAFFHYNLSLEILNMKTEFSQDDLGKIWLTYATEIYVNKVTMPQKLTSKQGELSELELAMLNARLDERIQECQGKYKFEQYSGIMMGIYSNAKQKADVDRVLNAKPISYANVDLIRKLQTQQTWVGKKSDYKTNFSTQESPFDPRNIARTKQRVESIKCYSRNDEFFPTSYVQRKEWIFTPMARSPEPRNKSSFSLREKNLS